MASLDSSIQNRPDRVHTTRAIIHQLWGPNSVLGQLHNGEARCDLDVDVYFQYYTQQCRLALHDGGRHTFVRTHRDILELVEHLKDPSQSRDSIVQLLRPKIPSSKPIDGTRVLHASIDLAARLLTMVDIGSLQHGFSGRKQLSWDHGSLKEFIGGYFDIPPALGHEHLKLQKMFTARNLGRMVGIEIFWTDNLADHLRMVDEDKKVAVFHHVSFLEYQQKNSMFPDGFIQETLRTFALLFPQSDAATQKWFQKVYASSTLDPRVVKCGHLRASDRQIENFTFWHDRLVILKQIFDQAHPGTLSQWWYDRRNGVQWYTFWVAILILTLTIFFGLVQSIEGALQVYKAFHPSR